MPIVCGDGFNIALPKGSGIATYGRNLLANNREIGLGGQILYGPLHPRNASNVVNEAALLETETGPKKSRKLFRYARAFISRFGRTAWPITPTGEVIPPKRAGSGPVADCYWAAQNLFHVANRSFSRFGTVTPVTFEGDATNAPDVMHWTATLPLYARNQPNIYTIHDLIPLRLPHTTTDDTARYARLCRFIARKADHIAVVSEATRQDVIRLLGVSEDRVSNTYQSVSIPDYLTERSQTDVALELQGVFNLGWKEYFLHYGAIEPKKNLGRIVEAYLASGSTTPLVIVGGRAWLSEGETALLDQVKREGGASADRIRRYEYMPYDMLISLIRGAKATVFPSLYEGFGLPVLESMALDTAVLTSTGGALPEIAGAAAVIVDPYDTQAITRGIQALDQDEGLRADIIRSGRLQAAKFSAEAYQGRLRDLYAKVGVG